MSVSKCNLAPVNQEFATQQIIARCANGPLSKRDLSALAKYRDHRVLMLDHVVADSLDFLADWHDLRMLKVYGCKINDCTALIRLRKLADLWYAGNRSKMPDVSFMSSLTSLVNLGIGYFTYLKLLPDLSRCRRLKRLNIFNCKSLLNVDAVTKIPRLQSFSIVCTPQEPKDLEAVMAMPTLQKISGAFGTRAKDKLFHDMIARYDLQYG